MHFAIVLASD